MLNGPRDSATTHSLHCVIIDITERTVSMAHLVGLRLLHASTEEIKGMTSGEGPVGVLKVQRGLSCHVCSHTDGVFVQFACGQDGHSFCREHLKQKFALLITLDGEPFRDADGRLVFRYAERVR